MVIPREPLIITKDSVETTRHRLITKAYIYGALHDATVRKTTYRISQKSQKYVELIAQQIKLLGGNAWTYREGKDRQVYIVEFSKTFLNEVNLRTVKAKIDYVRGYFDTDGGIAKQSQVRYYIYFCQKDFNDLFSLKQMLEDLKIVCGKIHNPSKNVDPHYWRFYISVKSYFDFARKIGSAHPEKQLFLRMKI